MLSVRFGSMQMLKAISKSYGDQVPWEIKVYDLMSSSLTQQKWKQFELWPAAEHWWPNWCKNSQSIASVSECYQKLSRNFICGSTIWAVTFIIGKWFGFSCHLIRVSKTIQNILYTVY